MARHRG
jgi:hypothetical protein